MRENLIVTHLESTEEIIVCLLPLHFWAYWSQRYVGNVTQAAYHNNSMFLHREISLGPFWAGCWIPV